jgi:NAD(P)-dependent dehydrogenase (short-subunit alcohol dehydrogenase family)
MDLYNASKWALNGLTFDWAIALRKHGIRVNALCLGAADTEMLRSFIGADPDPEFVATWMRPADVAAVLVALLEEGPDGRTGDNIGLYAGHPCVLPPPGPR